MSKTSFIAGITHSLSGLSTSGSVSRTLNEQQFIALSVTIGDEEETLPLGEVVAARYVFIKNISGDDLLVGTATGSYPFRLKEKDPCLLPLDTDGKLFEESTIACVADEAGSLNRKYFDMADNAGPLRVWFSTESEVTAVAAAGTITYGTPVPNNVAASGTITFDVYATIPPVAQSSYLGLVTLPINDEEFTIQGRTYIWKNELDPASNAGCQVKIDQTSSIRNTLNALISAINGSLLGGSQASGVYVNEPGRINGDAYVTASYGLSDAASINMGVPGASSFPFAAYEAMIITSKIHSPFTVTNVVGTNVSTKQITADFDGIEGAPAYTRQESSFQMNASDVPVQDGDALIIGSVTYTWRSGFTGAPNEVRISRAASRATAVSEMIISLKQAINLGTGVGYDYSYGTVENALVFAEIPYGSSTVVTLVAKTIGTAGAFSPAGSTPVDGTSVTIGSTVLYMVDPSITPMEDNYFLDFYDLVTKLNYLPGFTAYRSGLTITVVSDTPGHQGNSIAWTSIGEGVTVSAGGYLTGGKTTTAITVGTTAFTYAATPVGNQFSTKAGLVSLIEGLPNVGASVAGNTITVTATTPGTAGNSITLATNAVSGGEMVVSAGGSLTGGVNASGSPAIPTGGRLLRVPITAGSTASQVANSLDTALEADSFSTTISTNTVVATDNISGIRTPITDVDSGFTVSRTVSATSPFVVFLKSDGVSQVLIGVSPN